MNKIIYFYINVLALIIVFLNLISDFDKIPILRNLYLIISLIIFLLVSKLYEKKRKYVTPSYLFYFLVVFLSFNIGPYSLIKNKLMREIAEREHIFGIIPKDYYNIYFLSYILISFFIIIYLLKLKEVKNIQLNLKDIKQQYLLITFFTLLLPIYLVILGEMRNIFVGFTTYYIVSYFSFKEKIKIKIIGLFISIIILILNISWRFIFIQYSFPLILSFLFLVEKPKDRNIIKKIKTHIIILSGFIIVGLYGLISEISKLGKLSLLTEMITDSNLLLLWIRRQTYRIVEIWTILGGNILDYVNERGIYYGKTYLKFFSKVLDIEYISLPEISAKLIGASYAQTGLFAEGFANFGIYGAILNILFVFFIMEYFLQRLLEKKDIINLILVVVPFTKIILDGGSINSSIYFIVIIILTFILNILGKFIKKYLRNKTI